MVKEKQDLETYRRELFVAALLHSNRADMLREASNEYAEAKERYFCSVAIVKLCGFYSLDDDPYASEENMLSLESNNQAIDYLCQMMIASQKNRNLTAKALYLQAGLYWEFYGLGDEALSNLSGLKRLYEEGHKYYRTAKKFEERINSYSRLFGVPFIMKPL
jgi:hypothetical protein